MDLKLSIGNVTKIQKLERERWARGGAATALPSGDQAPGGGGIRRTTACLARGAATALARRSWNRLGCRSVDLG
uniref:Uncharacterized protein n=1 Tax=Oryza glumipatula TaxID=40148 RepID=A0A0E0B378_9ORYZ